jgi:hypothetical protein
MVGHCCCHFFLGRPPIPPFVAFVVITVTMMKLFIFLLLLRLCIISLIFKLEYNKYKNYCVDTKKMTERRTKSVAYVQTIINFE